jgi:hypothetical protein
MIHAADPDDVAFFYELLCCTVNQINRIALASPVSRP